MSAPLDTTPNAALDRAIAFFGGMSAMARALKLSGHQVVQEWRRQGRVPAPHCAEIERITGEKSELLNDTIDWEFYRTAGRVAA